jgi:hypothetical protein
MNCISICTTDKPALSVFLKRLDKRAWHAEVGSRGRGLGTIETARACDKRSKTVLIMYLIAPSPTALQILYSNAHRCCSLQQAPSLQKGLPFDIKSSPNIDKQD